MLTTQDFLAELRLRGATRLSRVSFRNNRCTVWSLTQRGRVLNVHAAYQRASPELLDAFALLVREGGIRSRAARAAAAAIVEWPELESAIDAARAAHPDRRKSTCCATPEQSRYLRVLYRYLNRTRFDGVLPEDVHVRLSNRMRSALGQMVPGDSTEDELRVAEIALNVDLMLAGNGAERLDTLLHEMAHVADYLETGVLGHGASWRAWAERVGCQPTRLYDRPVLRRRRRDARVTRVPPLPPGLLSLAG